jgi:hypothetical protein
MRRTVFNECTCPMFPVLLRGKVDWSVGGSGDARSTSDPPRLRAWTDPAEHVQSGEEQKWLPRSYIENQTVR